MQAITSESLYEATTLARSTPTLYPIVIAAAVVATSGKLVIIKQFLSFPHPCLAHNPNLPATDAGHAIRLARVVDEAGLIADRSGVHDALVVRGRQGKQVARVLVEGAGLVEVALAVVRQGAADQFAVVGDDGEAGGEGAGGKEAPTGHGGAGHVHVWVVIGA